MTDTDPKHPGGLDIAGLTVRIPLHHNGTTAPRRRIPLRRGAVGASRPARTARAEVVHAVTDVTLSVRRGTLTALAGESGCGKSMVAAAVLGMLPRTAVVSGAVRIGAADRAVDVLAGDGSYRGRRVALVPQSPATHFTPVRTIGSQLLETIEAVGSRHTCAELARRADFPPEALDRYPHELSGGMAQRAAVAAALAGDPEVIVADEPTSGLDHARTDHTLRLLRRCADEGAAVLLITHDLSALLRTGVADDAAIMYASHVVESGPAAEVLADPWHDYTRDLLAALPERGLTPLPHPPTALTNLSLDHPYLGRDAVPTAQGPRMIRKRGDSC